MGLRLARLAIGEDHRVVMPERASKSISAETTFESDLSTGDELIPILRTLAEKVSRRLKAEALAGRLVVLKLKTSEFKLRTRNVSLDDPTNLADRIFRAGRDLLRHELDGTRFRLLGIGVGQLGDASFAQTADLVDPGAAKRAKAELAMDAVRARYGRDGLALGLTFAAQPRVRKRLSVTGSPGRRAARSPSARRRGRSRRNP